MNLKIYFSRVDFNDSKFGDKKECVFVEFPNCISTVTKKPFKWMPTYPQLQDIKKSLDEVEKKSWKNKGVNKNVLDK